MPKTTSRLPHSQLTQHGPDHIIEKLHEFCFSLPNVNNEHTQISVPGARAMVLHKNCPCCNPKSFMVGREFAHIHPKPDNGSMHVVVSAEDAEIIKKAKWGEDHYLVSQGMWPPGLIMVFSPRDEKELESVQQIVGKSYEFFTGNALDLN